MKSPAIACAVCALVALLAQGAAARAGGSPPGDHLQPGTHDAKALQLLRIMRAALPMRTTPLKKIAPDFAIEKHEGLTWDAAVAEADTRFGDSQPARAAFLRKYLGKGSTESQIAQLKLNAGTISLGGAGQGTSYNFGPVDKPLGTIEVWSGNGQILDAPTLSVKNAVVENITYIDLIFDAGDHLISADRQVPPDDKGVKILLGENLSGEGDTAFFWVQITTAHGGSETIEYYSDLTLKERTVNGLTAQEYREVYDHGKLRKRTYYKKPTAAGGSQEIDREEKFP